jgi:molybdate transport system substrate-binding protein
MPLQTVRRAVVAALGATLIGVPLAATAQSHPPAPVVVFAAASLKNAFDDIAAAYTAKTAGQIRLSYGASPALARQIEAGAPADVFVSADADWMNYAVQKGLIARGSRFDLLTNHLALIAPAESHVRLRVGKGMPLAAALGAGRLAVAGPEVPAGKYARASLANLNVWESVSGKLASAENVRAALQFVARGETPLGIVYDTDAKVEPKVRIVGLFPDASHPPIVYPAALVGRSTNPSAGAFLKFLRGPEARAVFHKYGFTVLP